MCIPLIVANSELAGPNNFAQVDITIDLKHTIIASSREIKP